MSQHNVSCLMVSIMFLNFPRVQWSVSVWNKNIFSIEIAVIFGVSSESITSWRDLKILFLIFILLRPQKWTVFPPFFKNLVVLILYWCYQNNALSSSYEPKNKPLINKLHLKELSNQIYWRSPFKDKSKLNGELFCKTLFYAFVI